VIKVPKGSIFDEKLHDAVEVRDEKGTKKNEIIDVALTGWQYIDGQVIRPAKVIVAK